MTNATPIQDNGIDPKTPVVKEEIKPSWGVSAAYTRFIFASETSKSVYSSLNGFEAKVFYREKRSELGVFCVNQYGDGDPIEYGNVPPGATSHMRFFLIGLDSKVFVGKIFYFSLRTGYATVKESLTAMNQTGSASIDEWLLSPGVGLDIPTGDKFGLSAHVRYENFWVPALNGWNFGGGIFIKF